jgi:hypothetical protein
MLSKDTPVRRHREMVVRRSSSVPPPERNTSPARVSTMLRQPWRPSSANADSPSKSRPLSTERNHLRASSSDNVVPGPRFTKVDPDQLEFRPPRNRIPSETLMKKKKKKSKKSDTEVLVGEMSASVLKATKNLEQISKHLKTVAESLSESALLNLTNDQIQQHQLINDLSHDHIITPSNSNGNHHNHNHHNNQLLTEGSQYSTLNGLSKSELSEGKKSSSNKYNPLSESEEKHFNDFLTDDLDLASLIKERMHLKLKNILQSQLN